MGQDSFLDNGLADVLDDSSSGIITSNASWTSVSHRPSLVGSQVPGEAQTVSGRKKSYICGQQDENGIPW